MIEIDLPDPTTLGEPLPITEAPYVNDMRLALVVEENGVRSLRVVTGTDIEVENFEPVDGSEIFGHDDPRIRGFFPIVGRKGVNSVVRPIFEIGQRVLVRHQFDLGVCTVRERCRITDQEFLDGDVPTRVGYYVVIRSRKVTGELLYHESSLTLEPQVQYAPEAA